MAQSKTSRSQERKRGWRTTQTGCLVNSINLLKNIQQNGKVTSPSHAPMCNSLPEARQYHIHDSSAVAAQSGSFSRGIWGWHSVSLMSTHLSPQASRAWCITICLLQDPHCAMQAGFQNQSKKEQSCSLTAQLPQSWLTCSPYRLVVNLM